jgi:iron complex outermembrane receptor protein
LGASDARNARIFFCIWAGMLWAGAAAASADSTGLRPASADSAATNVRAASVSPSTDSTGIALGDSVLVLPEVRVDDQRPTQAARRLPTAFTSEIRPGARGGAIDLLPELMAEVPGIHVQQYGGLGAFSVMSVRGSAPGQVAVLLDGTPLTSAAHTTVSLSDLPVTAIERVEVYQGSSPLGLGPAGAAGTINFVTLGDRPIRELRLATGSFDTWEARGTASGARGTVSGLAHAGYQGSRGNYPYHDDNGTPFNLNDDAVVPRSNNRFEAWNGLGSLGWRPSPRLGVTARAEYFGKRQGLAGLGSIPTQHAALDFERALGQLEVAAAARGNALPRSTLRAGSVRERTQFQDLSSPPELGFGTHDTDDRSLAHHLDLELEWATLPAGLAAQATGALSREEARLHDAADGHPDPPPSRRQGRAVMVGGQWRVLGDQLLLHAAERWDRIDDALHSLGAGGVRNGRASSRVLHAPQLGARVKTWRRLELRANWSKADRPPDFLELFGNEGSVLGNPALVPEQVESWDAGASWTAPLGGWLTGALTWAHFESRSRDLILYVRNSPATVRAENIAAAYVHGEELGWHASHGALRASGSFTWQSAVDESDAPSYHGKRLAQRPGREGYAQLVWDSGALGLGADVHYLADNYLDRYNLPRNWIASRTLTGAWISLGPRRWPVRFSLEGKNLGDRRVEDVAGFPLPGRTVFLACESRLGPFTR